MAVAATTGQRGGFRSPPVWAVLLVIAVGIAGAVVIPRVGYRLPAIEEGAAPEETRTTVLRAIQSTTILRFAMSEAIAFISFALAFVVGDGGAIVCVIGIACSLALGFWHVWPSDRVVTRIRGALERDGGQSLLDEVLDSPPASRRS